MELQCKELEWGNFVCFKLQTSNSCLQPLRLLYIFPFHLVFTQFAAVTIFPHSLWVSVDPSKLQACGKSFCSCSRSNIWSCPFSQLHRPSDLQLLYNMQLMMVSNTIRREYMYAIRKASPAAGTLNLPNLRYGLAILYWNNASIAAMPRLAGKASVMAVASFPWTSTQALRMGKYLYKSSEQENYSLHKLRRWDECCCLSTKICLYPLQFSIADMIVARLHATVVLASTIE